jgi:hypothetical protein
MYIVNMKHVTDENVKHGKYGMYVMDEMYMKGEMNATDDVWILIQDLMS